MILNANYRLWKDNKKQTVPAPIDPDTPNVLWWFDRLAQNAAHYKRLGFASVLLPPVCKTQGGHANDADGYGYYGDVYDIGSKNQCYSTATRFGTADQLRRLVAINNACGLDSYGDIVLHQMNGGRNGEYKYLGADGKTLNGRWPKHPECFVGNPPRVPIDPVFSMEGNFAFGDLCSYVNSTPPGYMTQGAIDGGDWLVRTVGFEGLRIDDTKGMNTGFVHRFVTSKAMAKIYCFGELFDGSPDTLNYWVWNSGMQGKCSTIDFTIHWHLQNVCDNRGNASDLLSNGCAFFKQDPFHAISYVESPDTDLSPGQQIISNKGLCYWYILMSEGNPLVYYRDMAADPMCYGMEPIIANLGWIRANLCFGSTIPRHGDQTVACFERTGYPGMLTAGNWDTWNSRTITVNTNFGPGTLLHDYAGHHPDIWTDGQGRATFTIPSNTFSRGVSFVCFSRPGYNQPFALNPQVTKQEFFGAEDLDIGPAQPNGTHTANLWCEAGTPIELSKSRGDGVRFIVTDSAGNEIISRGKWEGKTKVRGWHHVVAYAQGAENTDYIVAANYMGTQGLTDDDLAQPAPAWLPAYVAPPAQLVPEKS